jgi:hypothetical protein
MADSSAPRLMHAVFFTLKDRTPQACNALVAACQKYLTDHPGTVHCSAGLRGQQYVRPVNDREFDVALVLVFATEADHDRYQSAPRHRTFVEEQSPNWAEVRVFDALV